MVFGLRSIEMPRLHLFMLYMLLRLATAINFSSIAASAYSPWNTSVAHFSQIYSLDFNGNVYLDAWVPGRWLSTVKISLSIPPKRNSPLAAVSWADEANSNLRLYYLNDQNIIMEAAADCGLASCSSYNWWQDNSLTSAAQGIAVDSNSPLAAVYIRTDGQLGTRLFYRDPSSSVFELACDQERQETDANCWAMSSQILDFDSSSNFAAAADGSGGLLVYGVQEGKIIGAQQGSDTNGTWTSLPGPTNGFSNPSAPLSVAEMRDGSGSIRLYWINSSEYVNEWVYQSDQGSISSNNSWPYSDVPSGPIAAIVFNAAKRVYYSSDGTLLEMAEDVPGVWYHGALNQAASPSTANSTFQTTANSQSGLEGLPGSGSALKTSITDQPTSTPFPTQSAVSASSYSGGISRLDKIGICVAIPTGIVSALAGLWMCIFHGKHKFLSTVSKRK